MTDKRGEAKSEFYPILESLVKDVPGAVAAIFCDGEGESIDFCGSMDPYNIKIIGAYTAVISAHFLNKPDRMPCSMIISCRRLTLVIRHVKEYILALVLKRRTFSACLEEAVETAAHRFMNEAGI